MGLFKKLATALGLSKYEARIVVVGLDNSGKTTLINNIKPKKASTFEVTPTVGFQVESFAKDNLNFTIFDMSGQSRYRELWGHYYREVQAIIFVLDCTERVRMCVAKEELDELLTHPDVSNSCTPILIFANKMDLPGALSAVDCMEQLDLQRISNKPWQIEASNALTGEGIDRGLEWLAEKLRGRK
ncbi:ADP-ribosylation factor family [Tribonema minus]|uniref:ADP-ribosylation factor-like protein 6 n=1 Tax=Tribonema minus TaxID=303371 RepID=A0A835YUJ0_9STRA|nr:ADP-ribosylation factor family [Tribonema minus]